MVAIYLNKKSVQMNEKVTSKMDDDNFTVRGSKTVLLFGIIWLSIIAILFLPLFWNNKLQVESIKNLVLAMMIYSYMYLCRDFSNFILF